MNDLRTGEPTDEFLRDLVGWSRADAPAPDPWSDVVARRVTGSTSRVGWMPLVAAAAVIVIGVVGLVLALGSRGGDVVPVDTVEQPTATAQVALPAVDPLADLGEDDWVAPIVLPDGYEPIVAALGPFDSQSDASILVGGADVDEITIQSVRTAGVPDPPQGDTEVDVDGIIWTEMLIRDDDGNSLGRSWQRVVGQRTVRLSTSGDNAPLAEIAAALRPVADDELTIPRLVQDPDLDVDVAHVRDAVLRAYGANGVYCLSIAQQDVGASSGCAARTEPGRLVANSLGLGGPKGPYAAGVAEANVARIEFVVPSGTADVEPVDESGVFEQRFWITDDPAFQTSDHSWAVVTYDDGSTAAIRTGRAVGAR